MFQARISAGPWAHRVEQIYCGYEIIRTPVQFTAILAGGALRGGRVVADWPGLKQAQLYEERDLRPTIDLRAVLKGLLKDHLRVDGTVLASKVFPNSAAVKPMAGLLQQA